ncbi:MAG: YceI family protein [Planctomycetes bacterium]|nr:YceI family protein [Planctomycetota bacterium]
MKYTLLLALPALIAAPILTFDGSATATSLAPSPLKPATFKMDTTHSWILFKVNHLGLGTAWGSFNKFEGSFVLDSEKAGESSVSLTMDAASVDTNNKKRDDHLKGPDFFNSKEFPTITFTSTKVTGEGKAFKVTGTLEMLGKKKEVTVAMSKIGEGQDPWGNHRAGFEGSFSLDRTDFGMDYMKDGGLGKEVVVTLAIEGVRE